MPKGIYVRKMGERTAIGNYRPKCVFVGCENPALKTHKRKDGGWYCDKFCQKHHRSEYGMRIGGKDKARDLMGLSEKPCEICGWHEARCDLHRVLPGSEGGKYTRENVRVLCPNHHRIMHPERYSLENHKSRNR
jgi:hypothetical protein